MSTITINWLNKCRCGNKSHTVKTVRGNETGLWDDDAVKCNSCGRGGVIQVCEGQARVLWETDEEMAEGKSMSTITRELAKLFRKITNSEIDAEGNAHVVLSPADSILINNTRMALAVEGQEPVAWLLSGGGAKNNVSFDSGNAYADPLREVTPLYASPPAPVSVPDALPENDDEEGNDIDYMEPSKVYEFGRTVGWNACRAAMLHGAEPVTTAGKLPFEQWLSQQTGTIDVECGCVMTEVFFHWLRVAYEAGNSPVIPDGYVLVPVEPTEDMIIQGFESEPDESFSDEKEWEAYDAMSGCQQAAHRAKLCWAAMIAAAPKRENI